jgi:ABC-type phosphate/phosphonate transport system substrate-binding protein
MYDADRGAVQAWWCGVAAAMRLEGIEDVPDAADWPADLDAHWRDPRLLLSQTCGHPLVTRLASRVQVVGAFRYTAPGCSGILYRSELLARADDRARSIEDFRGRVAVFNERHSFSGRHALRLHVAPLARDGRFFARSVESGSHRNSLALVRDGQADLAAVDCVTLAGLRRSTPQLLDGLRVIGATLHAPGLPLVTASTTSAADLARLRRALTAACLDGEWADIREALFIGGFVAAPASAWLRISQCQEAAATLDPVEL